MLLASVHARSTQVAPAHECASAMWATAWSLPPVGTHTLSPRLAASFFMQFQREELSPLRGVGATYVALVNGLQHLAPAVSHGFQGNGHLQTAPCW
jgi:hypothetical protein